MTTKFSIIITLLAMTTATFGQTFSDKISKEYVFEKKSPDNAIIIANINGDVKITGYDGDKVVLEVNRSISAKTHARLERGKQELQLGVLDRADTLIFYIKDQCNSYGFQRNRKNGNWHNNGWGYNWNCNNGNCDSEYVFEYEMDFTVKVPRNVHVMASTINEGNVVIENVTGRVDANNINGSIRLTNVSNQTQANTINGDVDIDYSANPKNDCRYYSLNGDINALFPKGLAATLSFDSFNGEFYTNIDKIESLPSVIQKNNSDKGLRFKINGNRYKVGEGADNGLFLDFETFNGNVYLKEK